MVPPTQEALLARRIGAVTPGLFAHADYLRTRTIPHDVAALSGHRVIGHDEEDAFIGALRSRGLFMPPEAFSLRTDSNLVHVALVRAGAGIGVCQVGLAAREASLVRLLADALAAYVD